MRFSKDRLRSQYLPDNAICFYIRVTVDGQLASNAFACRWTVNNKTVCWVTQLVVDRDYQERGLAKNLLNQLKQNDIDIYSLISSYPAACLVAAKAFGSKHTKAL
jgi:ribosomal protein S18 acetylase RimI-like enzyme